MANSVLPATTLPSIGNTQVSLENDVLLGVVMVVGLVLYLRGVPQSLWNAIINSKGYQHSASRGITDYGNVGPFQNQVDPSTFPPGSAGATPGTRQGFVGPPTPANQLYVPPIGQVATDAVTSAARAFGDILSKSPFLNNPVIGQAIVPQSSNPANFQAGGSVDPQPGGIVGNAPFTIPTFTSCWVLPNGQALGQCQG
jgi:hypothetical protein